MTRARDIANLVDSNGDVVAGALDNVPPADLVNDTSPQLGGNLDLNSSDITGTGNLNINGTTTTNKLVVDDDGSSSALLEVRADDNQPWAFLIANDSYSSGDNGILAYVDNAGTGDIRSQGSTSYRDLNFRQDGGTGGGPRTMMQMASNGEARLFHQGNMKLNTDSNGVAINGNIRTGSYNSIELNSRGFPELAPSNAYNGTGSWHVYRAGNILRATKYLQANGASAANHNLFMMRRHYWGGGHFKIILKRTYYNHSSETHYWINGNTRPNYSSGGISIGRNSVNSDLGSGRIYQVSSSQSYPGDTVTAAAVIIGLNVPSYEQYQVELEFDCSSTVFGFSDANVAASGNSFRLL